MKDLIQWAVMTDAGAKTGWAVMGILMLSLVWIHVMWFFKRPIWKTISGNVLFPIYLCTVIFVTLIGLVMVGMINLSEDVEHGGNPILFLYMFVAAPVITVAVLIVGYRKLLKVREKIPEA